MSCLADSDKGHDCNGARVNEPDLLIADKPTTALDVTIQAQILELLKDLQERLGMAMLLITMISVSDGWLIGMCNDSRKIVERGSVKPSSRVLSTRIPATY